MKWLPCGVYHEYYSRDHAFWQTSFVRGKMILTALIVFVLFPLSDVIFPYFGPYFINVLIVLIYTILAAMGVQLLIGFCGQVTLGHGAFVAVGAYTAALVLMHGPDIAALESPSNPLVAMLSIVTGGLIKAGLLYPVAIVLAGIVAGLWCVLFGLPSAKVKGFYLIMTTIAAQWITVEFFITQYVSQIGGRAQAFSVMPDNFAIGPLVIDSDRKVYILGAVLVVLLTTAMANLVRSKPGAGMDRHPGQRYRCRSHGREHRVPQAHGVLRGRGHGRRGRCILAELQPDRQPRALSVVLVLVVGRRYSHRGRRQHSGDHLRIHVHGVYLGRA